jgi:TldD protein
VAATRSAERTRRVRNVETLVDRDAVERTLARALGRGGDFAEVFVEDRRTTGISLDDGRVEELSSGRDRGAGIRVVVGETTGYAHTADLSDAGLLAAAEAASAVARSGTPGTVHAGEHPGASSGGRVPAIYPETVAKSNKVELLRRADASARGSSGSIVQVSARYGDSRRRILVANSDGLFASDDQVRTNFGVTAVASGDTGRQTGYESIARTVGFELFDLESIEDVAGRATTRAVTKLTARPAPSGVVPIVIKSGSGGILFHEACGHGLEADAIAKDASVYARRRGELVASPLVTLIDDGTIGDNWGTIAIDDEGHPTSRNVLIENGVLTDYMWDFLRARKEGREVSANGRRQNYQCLPMVRMTNTYLIDGESDPDEIVAQTPNGVYVARLGGGSVNTATGDFVFGMTEAYLIEDGVITAPIRDANLIGNGPDILRKVDAVANDFGMTPGTCGKDGQSVPVGCGQPTLRVTGMTIGGTAGA